MRNAVVGHNSSPAPTIASNILPLVLGLFFNLQHTSLQPSIPPSSFPHSPSITTVIMSANGTNGAKPEGNFLFTVRAKDHTPRSWTPRTLSEGFRRTGHERMTDFSI